MRLARWKSITGTPSCNMRRSCALTASGSGQVEADPRAALVRVDQPHARLEFHPARQHLGRAVDVDIEDRRRALAEVLQALGGAVVDQHAAVDEEDRVAHLGQLGEDVRTDEDRLALARQQPHELLELDPRLRVQPGGGFVQQQHVRIVQQRAAQAEPLRHALGKLVHHASGDGMQGR